MRLASAFLFASVLLPCCVLAQQDRLSVKRDPNEASRFICEIEFASFTTPKGWQPNRSDKQTHALLTRADESAPDITAMISIDVGKPVTPSAAETAKAFAQKWGGTISKEPVKVDGVKGYRVTIEPTMKQVRPVDCVVVIKDERLFMLIGGSKEDVGIAQAIDDLILSWKWKDKS